MFQTVLRGAKFRPLDAQAAVLEASAGTEVTLEPEPTNRFDPNAIKILLGEHFIGYVAKEDCEDVHEMRNSGNIVVRILEQNGLQPPIGVFYDYELADDSNADLDMDDPVDAEDGSDGSEG